MRTLLRKLFARTPQASCQAARAPRLGVERLDERVLLSASPFLMQGATTSLAGTGVSATLSGSTLSIQDSGNGETVQVMRSGTQLFVAVTESDGSGHAATSMPFIPVSVGQVRFQSSGQKDSFSNLLGTPSSFSDGTVSASYAPSTHTLSAYRLSASDDLGVATLSGSQAMYSAKSGSWFLPGGAVTSLVHGGASLSVQGGDSTYLLHQSSAGDSVATLSVAPHDTGLRKVFVQDATRDYIAHSGLTRSDLLDLFTQAGKDGTVSAQELTDLQTLVGATSVSMPADVRDLAGKVVNDNTANATFGTAALGDLHAGSSSTQLNELVQKWFYGSDLPDAAYGQYQSISGPLFGSGGPSYTDVYQGATGDCYLLASLGEVAYRNPQAIKDMFHDNSDGTYTVRFFSLTSDSSDTADYVTVNTQLPVAYPGTSYSYFTYAGAGSTPSAGDGPLWVALAEKAYAQMDQEGVLSRDAGHSYDAINSGNPGAALMQITGRTYAQEGGSPASDAADLHSAFAAGEYVVLGSKQSWGTGHEINGDGVVNSHAYAYLGYDPATGLNTLFNPWGINNGSAPGILHLTDAQLATDFQDFNTVVQTGGLAGGLDGAAASTVKDKEDAHLPASPAVTAQAPPVGVTAGALADARDAAFAGLEGSSYWDLVSHHHDSCA